MKLIDDAALTLANASLDQLIMAFREMAADMGEEAAMFATAAAFTAHMPQAVTCAVTAVRRLAAETHK